MSGEVLLPQDTALSNTALTRCLTVAPAVVAMVSSLLKTSLKQMTRHLARLSPQQTELVVVSKVSVCNGFPLSSWSLNFCKSLAGAGSVQNFLLFLGKFLPVTLLLLSESYYLSNIFLKSKNNKTLV